MTLMPPRPIRPSISVASFAKLHASILYHEKFDGMSGAAWKLWTRLVVLVWDERQNGVVFRHDLVRLEGENWKRSRAVKELLERELLDEDNRDYFLHDWLDHQEFRTPKAKISKARQVSGSAGGHAAAAKRAAKQNEDFASGFASGFATNQTTGFGTQQNGEQTPQQTGKLNQEPGTGEVPSSKAVGDARDFEPGRYQIAKRLWQHAAQRLEWSFTNERYGVDDTYTWLSTHPTGWPEERVRSALDTAINDQTAWYNQRDQKPRKIRTLLEAIENIPEREDPEPPKTATPDELRALWQPVHDRGLTRAVPPQIYELDVLDYNKVPKPGLGEVGPSQPGAPPQGE